MVAIPDPDKLAIASRPLVLADEADRQHNIFEEALALAALGFLVFPCEQGGKHPVGRLVPNGCKNATRDPEAIKRWWSSGEWNIGVATGSFVAIDFDPRHGGKASFTKLVAEHGSLPRTPTCHTGGADEGIHVYFQQPPGEPIGCRKEGLPPGVDVKGVGGYVIAPPSLHVSGRRYEWDPNLHPASTPIAQMPEWLASLCRKGGASGAVRPVDYWSQLVDSKVGEGSRNDTVTRLVGHAMWTRKGIAPRGAQVRAALERGAVRAADG